MPEPSRRYVPHGAPAALLMRDHVQECIRYPWPGPVPCPRLVSTAGGAGVSAGIDMTLTLLARMHEDAAVFP